jgi:hypothetical protein
MYKDANEVPINHLIDLPIGLELVTMQENGYFGSIKLIRKKSRIKLRKKMQTMTAERVA